MLQVFSWALPFILLSFIISKAEGQGRGDVEPEIELRNGFGPASTSADAEGASCSCSGSVLTAVIVTAIIFLLLGAIWWYFKGRKLRPIAKNDPEALGRAAYDNPQFQYDDLDEPHPDQTRITIEPGVVVKGPTTQTTQCTSTTTTATNTTSTLERGKSTLERVMAAILRGSRSDLGRKTKDDSFLDERDVLVPIKSHDFAGLGFTVHGNIKEGLYVKDVLNSGPASQSGEVVSGDRIIALTIITEHVVFKDALTILSYASPYPILLHLKKKRNPLTGSFSSSSSSFSLKGKQNNHQANSFKLNHPAFRSQSHGDLSKNGENDSNSLHIGNLLPPLGKSPGISQKLFKMTRAEQRKCESRHSERAIDVPGAKVQVSTVNIDTGNSEDKTELANVQVHRSMSPTSGINLQQSSIEIPTFQDSCLSETSDNLKNVLVDKQNSKTKFGVKVFPDLPFNKGKTQNHDPDLESGVHDKNISITGSSVPKLTLENEAETQNKENSQIELNCGIHSSISQESNVEEHEKNSSDDPTKHIDINPIKYDVDLDKGKQPSISLTADSGEDSKFEMKCSSDKVFVAEKSLASNESLKKNFNDQVIFLNNESTIECESKSANQIVSDSSLNLSLGSKQNSEYVEVPNVDVKQSDPYIKHDSSKTNSKSNSEDSDSSDDKKSNKGIKISSIKLPSFGFRRNKETDSDSDSDSSTKIRNVEIKAMKESKSSEEKEPNLGFQLNKHEINPLLSKLKSTSESEKQQRIVENNFQGSVSTFTEVRTQGDSYKNDRYEENRRKIEASPLSGEKHDKYFEMDKRVKEDSSDSDSDSDRKYQQDVKAAVPDITMHSIDHKLNSEHVKETFANESKKVLKQDTYIPSFNFEAQLRNDSDLYSDDIESGIKVIESSKSDDEAIKRKPKSQANPSTFEFEEDFELKSGSVEDLNASWRKSLFQSDNNRESYCFMESEDNLKEHANIKVRLPEMILPSVRGKVESDATDGDESLVSQLQFRKTERKSDEEEESEDQTQNKLKHGIKIGMPDINVSSLGFKSDSKEEKYMKEEAEMTISTHPTEKSKDNSDSDSNFNSHINITRPSLSLDEVVNKRTNDADEIDENEHKPLRRLFSDFETDKTKKEKKKGKEKSGFNFKFKGPEFSFPNFGNKQEKQGKEKPFKKSESEESSSNSESNSDNQMKNPLLNKTANLEVDLQSFHLSTAEAKVSTNKDFDNEILSKNFETKVNVPESHAIQPSIEIQDPAFKIPALNLEQYKNELDFSLPELKLSKNTVSHQDETSNGSDKFSPSISLVSKRTSLLYGNTQVEIEGKTNAKVSENVVMPNHPEEKYHEDFDQTDSTSNIPIDFKVTTQQVTIPSISSVSCETEDKEDTCSRSDLKISLENNLAKEDPNLCIQLPRVKISNSRPIDTSNKELPDSECLPPASIKFPKVSLHQSTGSETDDWKIKSENGYTSINNVSLLREKFNSKLKEQEDAKETKNKFDLDVKSSEIKVSKYNVDPDEPDFLIPNLKLHSEYNSASFSPENFSIPTLKMRESDNTESETTVKSLDYELNWKQKQLDILNVESKSKTNLPSANSTTADVNISLDSSSIENESDLPEADSDYKKVSSAFMLDVPIPKLSMTKMNLEKSFNKNSEISYSKPDILIHEKEKDDFGNPFGFRGFKKHKDSEEKPILKSNREENSVEIMHFKIPDENNSFQKVDLKYNSSSFDDLKEELKNLPEADYDLDYKNKSFTETNKNVDLKISSTHLPEGDQGINYSIERKLKSLEKSYNIKHSDKNDAEEEHKITKTLDSSYEISKQGKFPKEGLSKARKDEEEEKTKSKIKLGLGFGFKAFSNKSSDSEDTEVENKISKEPDGNVNENAEKYRGKAKKTFSFKGFGKSSSDTEEEYSEKVSEMPMQKVEIEDKENLKTNTNMGMKLKGHKNSDSDDNVDPGKTRQKTKVKSNLSFGFISKSKAPLDVENTYLIDSTNDARKEQHSPENEDAKSKSKSKINLNVKGAKELKYDTRSESEGGDEDKINLDSKGEEIKGKSKKGIGFGFRKSYGKTSSDSEGGDVDEQRVHLDERGNSEKGKESKSKSIKLGFKGFKNLKGKIQTEINKMRHDSPSSDEGENEDNQNFNEKRKKIIKKKEKEKKVKRDSEKYLDATEEATLSSAALAAKDNRKKKHERKSATSSSSSSSSSSESSSEDEGKSLEQKKKKKSKLKRKDETKVASSSVNKGSFSNSKILSEEDNNYPQSYVEADAESKVDSFQKSHVTVVMSEPTVNKQENVIFSKQNMEIQSDPRNYVVVREMKLKENSSHFTSSNSIQSYAIQRSSTVIPDTENDGFGGSDSDMDKSRPVVGEINSSSTSVAIDSSGKQRVLTDSEELKRRAASLGDLSRLHEGTSTGTLLERAVSLDLKSASVGPPNLHVRRLQLPDSSATSIDENDESTVIQSPKKAEIGGFLKSASQWGTLEEAMVLGGDGKYKQIKLDAKLSSPVLTDTPVIKTTNSEGVQISNIEISGEKGSSITALSAQEANWDDSFEDDEIPSLPSSPIPVEKTTITVMKEKGDANEYLGSDSNIVVVGSEPLQAINNIHNFNFHLHPSKITSSETQILSHQGMISSSNTSINSDSGRYSPRPLSHGENDVGGVTITMVSAESHLNTHNISSDSNHSHLTKTNKFSPNISSDLIQYESMQHPSLVTVSHDLLQENGEIVIETTEHNVSDEFITHDLTPQKTTTQITLDGEGVSGFTVTEGGTFSRTVIISNPELDSSVNIVQAQERRELSS